MGLNVFRISFFTLFVLLALLGCNWWSYDTTALIKNRLYEDISDKVLGGDLQVEVSATITAYYGFFRSFYIKGPPYRLQFRFFSKRAFKHIAVENLILVGHKSGERIQFGLRVGPKSVQLPENHYLSRYVGHWRGIVTFPANPDNYIGLNFKYEDYDLKALLHIVLPDGKTEKTPLYYKLKKNYKEDYKTHNEYLRDIWPSMP